MAIQVYRQENNFNSPIGVAGVSQAPTRLANTFSRVTENIAGMVFQNDVETQKQEAVDNIANVTMRDEDGKLVVKPVPDTFSKIQKREAQPYLDKMYAKQIELDVKKQSATLAREYANDPEGFLTALSGWQDGYEPATGKYSSLVNIAVESYGLQHANALYVDRANLEDRLAFNTANALNDDNIRDFESSALDFSPEFNNAWLEKSLAQIEELYENHPTRYSSDNRDRDRKAVLKAHAKVPVTKVVNAMANTVFDANPEVQQSMVEAGINSVSLSLRGLKSLSEDDYALLSQFGFTKEFLNSTPQVIKSDLASELTTIANGISENYNLKMNQTKASMSLEAVNNNVVITTDNASNLLKTTYNIETVEDFMNVFFDGGPDNPKSPFNDTSHPLNKMLVNQRQQLPKVVKDMFSQDNMLEVLAATRFDKKRVNEFVNLFNRVTRDRTNQFMSRGFSDDTITFMTGLEALSKTAQATEIGGVLSRLTDPTYDVKSMSEFALGGEKLTNYINDNFSINPFGPFGDRPATPQEFNFVQNVAPQLLAVYGKKRATEIIEQTLNRRFYRQGSKYMVPEFNVSQYAPESLYSGEDLDHFDFIVENALLSIGTEQRNARLNGELPRIGKNVFLMEPRNVYGAYPDYIVVDEDNIPIITNGTMLTIPRAGMIKHHKELDKLRESEMIEFRNKASQGPFMPQPASSGNISSQAEEIARANENR